MTEDLLQTGAEALSLFLTEAQREKFRIYLKELQHWSDKINLTSIKDADDIIVKHFLDSLAVLLAFPITSQSIIDIGAGAGLPGIPIKIVRDDVSLTLLDSVGKKVEFLKHVIAELKLNKTSALWGRAEDLAAAMRGKFDIAISRAVAPLNILCEYCLPFVKVGGFMIALKSDKIDKELEEAKSAIKILGGSLKEVERIKLPTTDIVREIVIIEKIVKTPAAYPRKAGTAKKKPL